VHQGEEPSTQIGARPVKVELIETAEQRLLHEIVGAFFVAQKYLRVAPQLRNRRLNKLVKVVHPK
jgi:hypothetical protein